MAVSLNIKPLLWHAVYIKSHNQGVKPALSRIEKMESISLEQLQESRSEQNLALVIGSSGAGKSSLINHLASQEVAGVSHVGAGTQDTTGYQIGKHLIIVDTRGTDEIGAATETWQNVRQLILDLAPGIIIWCMDGSLRKELDTQFAALEQMLAEIFEKTRLDPKICIIANKMDLIEPAGFENLPETWPNLRAEKGKNINNRLSQILSLFPRMCRAELQLVEPTCLEWYKGARPWNLDNIKDCLKADFSEDPDQILRDLSLSLDMFQKVVAIQVRAIENDIAADADKPEMQEKKRGWLEQFREQVKYRPLDFNSIGNLPTDPLQRQVILQNLLAFAPYIPFSADDKVTIKFDQKRFSTNMQEILISNFSFNADEIKSFQEEFAALGKELQGSWFNWKNLVKIGLFGAIAGVGMWWLAPAVGGWLGATLFGLKGAAATSAGLAWLGLGSLAAGGFGMFGGTLILVGSAGVLAGASSGAAIAYMASTINAGTAMMNSAKMLQSYRLLLKLAKSNPACSQKVIDIERIFAQSIYNLQAKLATEKENRKNLEKSLEIFARARAKMTADRLLSEIRFHRETR
ncbi:MAG: hypothetical protein CVV42_06060 [Candidatus Riflebacteria bacterium HGW-Riflebacteria-2]|jgi:predicted GTPase|nr:MAG: hypothetical protein CVV42_06060 [Candidatus Riflebacteria bacterium HGW-Riflebacteria-2]